jgi:hypothetical protein
MTTPRLPPAGDSSSSSAATPSPIETSRILNLQAGNQKPLAKPSQGATYPALSLSRGVGSSLLLVDNNVILNRKKGGGSCLKNTWWCAATEIQKWPGKKKAPASLGKGHHQPLCYAQSGCKSSIDRNTHHV